MKLIPEHDVIKVKKDDKRNTKRRYLTTDGICFRCAAIVNYVYEKRCLLCCGSEEFLIGEHSRVLRELLELNIEELKAVCELRGRSIGSGSRVRMTFELFKLIFPKLTKIDKRIDEMLITKIITRNRKRFRYVKDIEAVIYDIRRQYHKRWRNTYSKQRHVIIPRYIKLVNEKDMAVECVSDD